MAANFFYPTMQFSYFYGFVVVALPLLVVFATREERHEVVHVGHEVAEDDVVEGLAEVELLVGPDSEVEFGMPRLSKLHRDRAEVDPDSATRLERREEVIPVPQPISNTEEWGRTWKRAIRARRSWEARFRRCRRPATGAKRSKYATRGA